MKYRPLVRLLTRSVRVGNVPAVGSGTRGRMGPFALCCLAAPGDSGGFCLHVGDIEGGKRVDPMTDLSRPENE